MQHSINGLKQETTQVDLLAKFMDRLKRMLAALFLKYPSRVNQSV